MENDYSMIGARIRYNRTKHHLTQEQLAEIVNLSNVYISYIERGRRVPGLDTMIKLANALGVSADDLLADYLMVSNAQLHPEEFRVLFDCSSEERAIITKTMSALKII